LWKASREELLRSTQVPPEKYDATQKIEFYWAGEDSHTYKKRIITINQKNQKKGRQKRR
jgi:hypothetical protein